jgi:hypothetical protein
MDMVMQFINKQSSQVISSQERSAMENVKNAIAQMQGTGSSAIDSLDPQHQQQQEQLQQQLS